MNRRDAASGAPTETGATRRRGLARAGALVVGLALFALLVRHLGWRDVTARLGRAGGGVAWLFGAYAAGTLVGALPWRWLIPRAARPSMIGTVASRFAASGVNALVPLFGVGGEACRLLWLAGPARTDGVAALVVDRTLFFAASALFLGAGVVAAVDLRVVPPALLWTGGLTAALALILAGGLAWAGAARGVVGPLARSLRRLRLAPAAAIRAGAELDGATAALLRGSRATLVAGLLTHVAARALLGAEVWAALWVLDVPVGVEAAVVMAAVPVALSIAGSVVPSQLGIQEGTQVLVAGALGLDPAIGMSVVILQRVRQLATVALAGLLVARASRRAPRPAV